MSRQTVPAAQPLTRDVAIDAYHKMPAPRTHAEHCTAAALLGLDLDQPDVDPRGLRTGPTLRARIHAHWHPVAAPTRPAASPPARRHRPSHDPAIRLAPRKFAP